jgi:hypothetical protein
MILDKVTRQNDSSQNDRRHYNLNQNANSADKITYSFLSLWNVCRRNIRSLNVCRRNVMLPTKLDFLGGRVFDENRRLSVWQNKLKQMSPKVFSNGVQFRSKMSSELFLERTSFCSKCWAARVSTRRWQN